MELFLPPIKISEDEGFTSEKDIFGRRQFGENLLNLIVASKSSLVVGLDAKWGEGKTTFVKMWRGYLSSPENSVKSIYFDAFANDYQSDPFFLISSELYGLIDQEDQGLRNEFKEKATSALKVISKIGLRVGIKAITAGVLDETIFEESTEDIGQGIQDATSKFVSDRLEQTQSEKELVESFKEFLISLPEKLNSEKPIIIIIDELDRCRPDFSLEILETVKHFFSLPGITFLIVMNREQVLESIRYKYGKNIKANEYLQKFINLWAMLPSHERRDIPNGEKYLSYCLEEMGAEGDIPFKSCFVDLINHYSLTFREIEQAVTNYAVIYNATGGGFYFDTKVLSSYVAIIKVKYPDIYKLLVKNIISFQELKEKTELVTLGQARNWSNNISESHPVTWCLKHSLVHGIDYQYDYDEILRNDGYSGEGVIDELISVMESFKVS